MTVWYRSRKTSRHTQDGLAGTSLDPSSPLRRSESPVQQVDLGTRCDGYKLKCKRTVNLITMAVYRVSGKRSQPHHGFFWGRKIWVRTFLGLIKSSF